jgi:hypothetical protein
MDAKDLPKIYEARNSGEKKEERRNEETKVERVRQSEFGRLGRDGKQGELKSKDRVKGVQQVPKGLILKIDEYPIIKSSLH